MRCLELFRTDPAQMAVVAFWIVKPIDVFGYVLGRHVTICVDARLDLFFFELLKKDSAAALSQQLARLLMLGSR